MATHRDSKTMQGQAEWAVHAQETNWQVVLADESGGGSYDTTGFDTGVTWHGHYKSVRGGRKNCTVHATCIAKGNAGAAASCVHAAVSDLLLNPMMGFDYVFYHISNDGYGRCPEVIAPYVAWMARRGTREGVREELAERAGAGTRGLPLRAHQVR